jgi:hypothetical protein
MKKLLDLFQTKMETVQVFIKTEEEDRKEDTTTQQTPYLLEETPCIEPAIFER